MTNSHPDKAGGPLLRLRGELDIYHVAALKEELLEALRANARLTLDLSEISEIDTAGVQLLLWASAYATGRGGSLLLQGASEAVRGVIAYLNLPSLLDGGNAE